MKKTFFSQPALLVSYAIALVLAGTEAPVWVSLFTGFLILWRWAYEATGIPKVPRSITGILSVLLVLQVYLRYGTLLGQEASNTMLVGLAALKIMDYEDDRDHKFVILLGFVMVSIKAVFTIDIYWAIPSLIAFTGLWYSLLETKLPKTKRFLIRLFTASIPLAVILFIAFPRFVVPWAMSRASAMGSVGFSDTMNPGGVAELASLDSLAFRAKFFGEKPKIEELYWRGTVLTHSQGLSWGRIGEPYEFIPRGEAPGGFRYEVIMEPYSGNFLFTLGYPLAVSSETISLREVQHLVYRSTGRITKPQTYEGRSEWLLKDQWPPTQSLLQVPELPPRAGEWVEQVLTTHSSPEAKIDTLNTFFKNPEFVYTLKPGTYLGEGLDDFLFERRRGFCEHFAGSYATLARALGIPARVVLGYQGGQYNIFGEFWRVSQKDAHAWVEIFLGGSWQRVDPTEWVAPLRLELGALAFFGLSEEEQIARARSTFGQELGISIVDQLSLWLDDLNYRWTYFLLEYNSESQRNYWQVLQDHLALFSLIGSILIGVAVLVIRTMLRLKSSRAPIEALVDEIIDWGQRRGHHYDLSKTPLNYLSELEGKFPERAKVLSTVGNTYDQAIYAEKETSKAKVQELKKHWQRLKA